MKILLNDRQLLKITQEMFKNRIFVILSVYPVEVGVDDDRSESLELWDQLNEQLLHQVQKSFAQGRFVEERVGGSEIK